MERTRDKYRRLIDDAKTLRSLPTAVVYPCDQNSLFGAVENTIYNGSRLLGVSGISGDMRRLLASDDARARFAV